MRKNAEVAMELVNRLEGFRKDEIFDVINAIKLMFDFYFRDYELRVNIDGNVNNFDPNYQKVHIHFFSNDYILNEEEEDQEGFGYYVAVDVNDHQIMISWNVDDGSIKVKTLELT